MVNKLTKKIKLAATHATFRAADVAEIVWREWVREYGVPRVIVSDRDPRFASSFWRELFRLLGTKLKMSSAYHPQTDGQTENTNKTVENMLRAYVNNHLDDWDEHLIHAEIAINNAVQDSTGYSPFYLTYGQHLHFPLQAAARASEEKESKDEEAKEFVRRVQSLTEEARRNLLATQEQQRIQANKHRRAVRYKVGDWVMLETKNLSNYTRKLRPKFVGPFKIVRVLGEVNVELDLPPVMEIGRVVHVEKLRGFDADAAADRFPTRVQISRPPAQFGKRNRAMWEVDRIVDERVKGRKKEYLIMWKGWPPSDATWEPATGVDAPDCVAEWERRKEGGELVEGEVEADVGDKEDGEAAQQVNEEQEERQESEEMEWSVGSNRQRRRSMRRRSRGA